MLKVEQLSFAYQKTPTLHNISFQVKPGEILVVLGSNGAGKSTLLKCIGGFLTPSPGRIIVDEQDIAHLGGKRLARRVAYLPQQLERCNQTVFEAVLLGRLPRCGRSSRYADKECVESVLNQLGLDHLALRKLVHLSGGELQKVAIARALVQEPKLLLLDEPTSALDLAKQVDILMLVQQLAAEQSLAVLMTMHDLSSALRFAHRFLLLNRGSVQAHGDVASIDAGMIECAYGVAVDLHHHQGCPHVVPRIRDRTEPEPVAF